MQETLFMKLDRRLNARLQERAEQLGLPSRQEYVRRLLVASLGEK